MKAKLILLVFVSLFITNCRSHSQDQNSTKNMIKVCIMYPYEEGKFFDMDYYKNNHMPMLAELFGDAMLHYEIDNGVSGRTPDEPIPFLAIGYLYFQTISDYDRAFGPNAEQIIGDIPNYTNIQPLVQISEVIK